MTQLEAIRDTLAGEVPSDKEALKHKASAVKDSVVNLASETRRYASHRLADARQKAAEWGHAVKDKACEYRDSTVDYIQRNPYKAIGMAAAAGFLIGLILKRR